MAINTNISIAKTEKQYYQRFVNLSVNETPLPQGDGMIRISPFDDFFLFTIYEDVNGEDTPIDLSNVENLFLNFIGTNDEIDINNHTQVEEVDLAQGEVLFRITRSDSKKILALDNNNFYVSTKMIDPSDGSVSDESILYQGIWLAVDDANRTSLTSQLEDTRTEYSIELARLSLQNEELKKDNEQLIQLSNDDQLSIRRLEISNAELENELAELTKDLDSFRNSTIMRKSKEAQLSANRQIRARQQVNALAKRAQVAQTGSARRGFFRQAANNLESYMLGSKLRGGSGTDNGDRL